MATSYSPNPWAAGAVVFNPQPWEAFYERQAAKKQAKEDALNAYFKDLNKNITSAGMRSQDVPQLLQKNQEWQDLYSQNKAAILNPKLDNGKAYSDYTRLYQEQQALVNESKEAHKSMDEIGKMKLNPKMSYVFEDPTFMDQVKKHELPIGHPDRVGINLASISMPPEPLTTKDLKAYQDYLTGGVQFDKVPGQTETLPGFKTRTPIYQQYSSANQKVIGQHAMNAYDTDPKWRREAVRYFDEIHNNPEEYKKANAIHQQLYGNPIDNPREAWAAKGILDNNMKATDFHEGKDEVGFAKYMNDLRTGSELYLAREKKKLGNDADLNNAWLEGYWRNRISTAKQGNPHVFTDPETGIGTRVSWEIKPDKVMLDALSRGGKQPDKVYVTDKNEIYPVFYHYSPDIDEKGKKIGTTSVDYDASGNPVMDKEKSQMMDLEQAMVSTGYKTSSKGKQLNQTMNGIIGGNKNNEQKTDKHPLPEGKPRQVKQNGHIYTWSEEKGTYE